MLKKGERKQDTSSEFEIALVGYKEEFSVGHLPLSKLKRDEACRCQVTRGVFLEHVLGVLQDSSII